MKTQTRLALFVTLVLACGASSQTVIKTVDDATACAVGIVATASGSLDVQQLLACGLTAADALALLQQLRQNATPDGGAAVSPERVAYVAKLDAAIAKLKAMQGGK